MQRASRLIELWVGPMAVQEFLKIYSIFKQDRSRERFGLTASPDAR